MHYRVTDLLDATDVGTAGTKTIPITIEDIISRLDITFKTTKSKHGMDDYTHKNITGIDLVDGSDHLFSMDGGQAQALGIYHRKVPTLSYGQHNNGDSEFDIFPIDFGRWLWDPDFAFDPKKFNNPQLKITYDEDVADTGVTANALTVKAYCFDEKVVSPGAFLMSKEHFDYTCGANNSYEYVKLPTDYPIRKLLVQGYRSAYEPWNVIKEARLSEESLKRIPFDWDLETYYRMMIGVWKPVEEGLAVKPTTGVQYYYVTPTDYWVKVMLANMTATTQIKANPVRGGKIGLTSEAISQTAVGMVRGYLPNHCFEFPFGLQDIPDDWYDVTKLGSITLRLKAGASAANGNGKVILQQNRPY